VDDTFYSSVQYLVEVVDGNKTYSCILGGAFSFTQNGKDGQFVDVVQPSDIGNVSRGYVGTADATELIKGLKGILGCDYDATLKVTPQWVTYDGLTIDNSLGVFSFTFGQETPTKSSIQKVA